MFCVLHGITKLPLCETCGVNNVKFVMKDGRHYYSNVCSAECSNKNKDAKAKRRASLVEHWADENLKAESLCKTRQTCRGKYNCDWPTQAESIKTKTVNTCLERYGETCAFKNSEIRAKARKTLEKRYGADWKKAVGQKILDTWRKKTEEERAGIADKARRTKAERYGDEKYVNVEKCLRTKDERRKSDPMYQQKINSKTKATICRKMAEDSSYRENINRKIVGTRMLHKAEDPDF